MFCTPTWPPWHHVKTEKIRTCSFFYDYLCNLKIYTGNLNLILLTKKHRYYVLVVPIQNNCTFVLSELISGNFVPRSLEDIIWMIFLSLFALDLKFTRSKCSWKTNLFLINLNKRATSRSQSPKYAYTKYHPNTYVMSSQ